MKAQNKTKKQKNTAVEWADKPKNTKAVFKRLMHELAHQKARLLIIIACTLLSCLLFIAMPIFLGMGIDAIVATVKQFGLTAEGMRQLLKVLVFPVAALATVALLSSLLAFVQQRLMASVGETVVLGLRKHISQKLTKLPLKFFDTHKTGDLLSRTTDDLEKVAEVLQTGAVQLVSAVFNITFTTVVMFVISPLMALIAVATILLAVLATKMFSKKTENNFAENQRTLGELNAKVEEYYTGNIIIKTFNKQPDAKREINELNENQYKAHKKAQYTNFAIYPSIRLLNQIGFIVSAVVGGYLVVIGKMSIGTIQAMLQYVNQVAEPTTQAAYVLNAIQASLAGAERVYEILDEEEEIADVLGDIDTTQIGGDVSFNHVRFGYSPEKILMQDVSLTVKPNQTVAIVGPTGAGKTTLVNLLMRFYELNGGEITIGGVNIKDISRGRLRRKVGIVLQDTWLFEGTVADNIAYGKMDAPREEIVAAATAARCDHFIRTLPEGYDTVISGEAAAVSQGQMQLLTIARAMLANPAIMILDEATSSVDTGTEMEIQKAMNVIMQNKTSFVIAHRLSTIKSADLILVMKNGTIIEKGTHEQLLSGDTFYADLYNSQFAAGTAI